MEQFNKTIDYFIQHEIMNRFNDIEIKEGKGIYLSKESFSNVEETRKRINKAKENKIKELFKNIKFKDAQYGKSILPDVLKCLTCVNEKDKLNEQLKNIIDIKKYRFPENYEIDIYEISNIILDNTLLVLYPTLAKGKKKIPLVTFECKIEGNKYVIVNYKVQQEAFRVIVASILKHGIREIHSVLGDEFYELLNSLSSIKNPDVFETVKIINEDIKGKYANEGFAGIWSIKDYEWWAVTEELAITLESFEELQQPIFKDELKHLKDISKESELPSIIQKYLYSNEKSKPVEVLDSSFHFGSYENGFSVNEKQWKVISAYNSDELISVSGPPGTGKTTVLKEIIADNFTRKIKVIVDAWNKPWEEFGQGNQKVFSSPFNGECNKSMVLTSTNNDAVDNIGLELLREVEYFSDIARNNLSKQYDNESLKGIFCARLGKKDNMDSFNLGALRPLIEYLKKSDTYDEEASLRLIENFNKDWEEISLAGSEIKEYIRDRGKVLEKLKHKNAFQGDITIELIHVMKSEVEVSCENIRKQIGNTEKSQEALKGELADINKVLNDTLDNIKQNEQEIKLIKEIIEKIKKYRMIPIIGNFIVKISKIERQNGSQEELENRIEDKMLEIRHFNSVKLNMMKEYEDKSKKLEAAKSELINLKEECKNFEDNLADFEEFQGIINKFNSIKEKYLLSCDWNDQDYLVFNDIEFVKKRNELFTLSLRINEAYISKYKKEIIFNLEKVYPGAWFQMFYKREFKYDETYTKCIKVIWETLFLCFPIATTTLHSFDKSRFHMIRGIFDTIMFDEAGQALLHTAVAPLYRARKSIIVGDVFQLEPIRGNEERLVERYGFDNKTESFIDIERNSVQHGADRGSDIYEELNEQRVGIVLDEHRRCESSIVQFSNKHVYENRLKIVKKDEEKEFLGKNLCFIDVRGSKNKSNENPSEAAICQRIVDKLLVLNGEEYRNKIGIITPYKNQVKLLEKLIPKVDVGTVHSFQGQEKECIILSTAIDDAKKNNGSDFVGRKPNFLNVAFTRAKKQLIVVGNYEAYKNGNNYLMNAIETIEECGNIFSIYKTDLTEEKGINKKYIGQFLELFKTEKSSDQIYDELLKGYISNGLLVEPKNHYEFLINVIQKSNKSVHIVSPWVTKAVVDDEMGKLITQKISNDNKIFICFGYHKTKYTLEQIEKIAKVDNFGDVVGSIEAINKLKEALKENLKYLPPLHTKALIIDEEIMLIGSHNWLSNNGNRKNAKDEISCVIVDKEMIEYVKRRYFN